MVLSLFFSSKKSNQKKEPEKELLRAFSVALHRHSLTLRVVFAPMGACVFLLLFCFSKKVTKKGAGKRIAPRFFRGSTPALFNSSRRLRSGGIWWYFVFYRSFRSTCLFGELIPDRLRHCEERSNLNS
jgi:hypothetical protein